MSSIRGRISFDTKGHETWPKHALEDRVITGWFPVELAEVWKTNMVGIVDSNVVNEQEKALRSFRSWKINERERSTSGKPLLGHESGAPQAVGVSMSTGEDESSEKP